MNFNTWRNDHGFNSANPVATPRRTIGTTWPADQESAEFWKCTPIVRIQRLLPPGICMKGTIHQGSSPLNLAPYVIQWFRPDNRVRYLVKIDNGFEDPIDHVPDFDRRSSLSTFRSLEILRLGAIGKCLLWGVANKRWHG
jgi:hypothetical protein